MEQPKYVMGMDFGTELLFNLANRCEIASAISVYANSVIENRLPRIEIKLEPDSALQDPQDYVTVLQQAVPKVIRESGVNQAPIIGLGLDFTFPAIMPALACSAPLSFLFQPHAWVKLWKCHAVQPKANKMLQLAHECSFTFLDGGRAA